MDFNNTSHVAGSIRNEHDPSQSAKMNRFEDEDNLVDFLHGEKVAADDVLAHRKAAPYDVGENAKDVQVADDMIIHADVSNNGIDSHAKTADDFFKHVESKPFDFDEFEASNSTNSPQFSDDHVTLHPSHPPSIERTLYDADTPAKMHEAESHFLADEPAPQTDVGHTFSVENNFDDNVEKFDVVRPDKPSSPETESVPCSLLKPEEQSDDLIESDPPANLLDMSSDVPKDTPPQTECLVPKPSPKIESFVPSVPSKTEHFVAVEKLPPKHETIDVPRKADVEDSRLSSAATEKVKSAVEKSSEIGPKDFFSKYGLVEAFIYWRDPKLSGIVFGSGLVLLLSLAYFSLISVVANTGLGILTCAIVFRIYKDILQAVQKTPQTHPYSVFLSRDIQLPQEKVRELVDTLILHINACLGELRRLFLVEDMIESLKFALVLWVLTYVGSWFNGLTLVIIGFVSLFTLPKVYENNKIQIDQNLALVRVKLEELTNKIRDALPAPLRRKQAEKKE